METARIVQDPKIDLSSATPVLRSAVDFLRNQSNQSMSSLSCAQFAAWKACTHPGITGDYVRAICPKTCGVCPQLQKCAPTQSAMNVTTQTQDDDDDDDDDDDASGKSLVGGIKGMTKAVLPGMAGVSGLNRVIFNSISKLSVATVGHGLDLSVWIITAATALDKGITVCSRGNWWDYDTCHKDGVLPHECATTCATDGNACLNDVLSKAAAIAIVGINIAGLVLTGGTSSAVLAIRASTAVTKSAKLARASRAVKLTVSEARNGIIRGLGVNVAVLLGSKVQGLMAPKFTAAGCQGKEAMQAVIAQYGADQVQEEIRKSFAVSDAAEIVSFVSTFDPTGLVAVAASFMHDRCKDIAKPFPPIPFVEKDLGSGCQRPSNWCTGVDNACNNLFFATMDIDGDKIEDLICTEEKKVNRWGQPIERYGTLASTQNCRNTWPYGVRSEVISLEAMNMKILSIDHDPIPGWSLGSSTIFDTAPAAAGSFADKGIFA